MTWSSECLNDGVDLLCVFDTVPTGSSSYPTDYRRIFTGETDECWQVVTNITSSYFDGDADDPVFNTGAGWVRRTVASASIGHVEYKWGFTGTGDPPFHTRYQDAITVEMVIKYATEATWSQLFGGDVYGLTNQTGLGIYSSWSGGNPSVRMYTDYTTTPYDVQSSSGFTNGNDYHVVLRWGSTSDTLSIWINGVKKGEVATNGVLRPHSDNDSQGQAYFAILGGYFNHTPGDYSQSKLHGLAIYNTELSDARILAHYEQLIASNTIGGTAQLEGGAAASEVVVREWGTSAEKARVVPDSGTGAWSTGVVNGTYEVTAYGPSGYAPGIHGPITVA